MWVSNYESLDAENKQLRADIDVLIYDDQRYEQEIIILREDLRTLTTTYDRLQQENEAYK